MADRTFFIEMPRLGCGIRAISVLLVTLLSACGSSQMSSRDSATDPLLGDAISRWDSCVQRSIALSTSISKSCEGHRRDITARYPRHLESQINAQLEARERTRLLQRASLAPDESDRGSLRSVSEDL